MDVPCTVLATFVSLKYVKIKFLIVRNLNKGRLKGRVLGSPQQTQRVEA
jgi:hypothetical protein